MPPPTETLGVLLARPGEEQRRLGYADTLREVLQQPETWLETASLALARRGDLEALLSSAGLVPGAGTVLLTGSGSSLYVGEALAPGLRAALGTPVLAVPSGDILTHAARCVPAAGPLVVVSFARSGDSPESRGALEILRTRAPRAHHLVVTCNRAGHLARAHTGDPRIARIVLDERTNDRSLVMTSSFTNLALAGRLLGRLRDPEGYQTTAARLSAVARAFVDRHADTLAALAARVPRAAVHLGTAGHLGAARECSLKMLEMTAGRVVAFAETFLGLRHGPMSVVREDTLVVAYLSADPVARAYELDLLRELRRKQPRAPLVVVGDEVPADLVGPEGAALACPGRDAVGDDDAVLLDVLVGQLLGLFFCRALGLRPDAPSPDGTISRIVHPFTLHDVT